MKTQLNMFEETTKARDRTGLVPRTNQALPLLVRLLCVAVIGIPGFGAHAAAVLTTLYSFTGTNYGRQPECVLLEGSDGYFYGTTYWGGTNNLGTVFKITSDGMLTSLHSFDGTNDGSHPLGNLVQGSDGSIYGTTQMGGAGGGAGTVFKITSDGVLTTLHSFTGGSDGEEVFNGLVQGSDGCFYGTTGYGGGANAEGTLFKITSDGVLTTLHTFWASNRNDGLMPYAGLVQGSDGGFYGATTRSGVLGMGTIFQMSMDGTLTTLCYLTNNADPMNTCYSTLVAGSDGYFYGTILGNGGKIDAGSVFKVSTNGTLTTLYKFTGGSDGGAPNGLLLGRDGNFYGTTAYTAFQLTPTGVFTPLYSFNSATDGWYLEGGLVQGHDGSFYGTTSGLGPGGGGTVFRLTIVPAFVAMTVTTNTVSLTWSTQPGATYQLQYSSDFSSSNWNNLGGPMTAPGTTLNATHSMLNGSQRFYRLAVVPGTI